MGEGRQEPRGRRLVGAEHWALPALVTQSCCSARPAPMVPWQPGCQGTQVATEPGRPEPSRQGEEPQRWGKWGRGLGGEGQVGEVWGLWVGLRECSGLGRHMVEGALGWKGLRGHSPTPTWQRPGHRAGQAGVDIGELPTSSIEA